MSSNTALQDIAAQMMAAMIKKIPYEAWGDGNPDKQVAWAQDLAGAAVTAAECLLEELNDRKRLQPGESPNQELFNEVHAHCDSAPYTLMKNRVRVAIGLPPGGREEWSPGLFRDNLFVDCADETCRQCGKCLLDAQLEERRKNPPGKWWATEEAPK